MKRLSIVIPPFQTLFSDHRSRSVDSISHSRHSWLGVLIGSLVLLGSGGWGSTALAQSLFHAPFPDASVLKLQGLQLSNDAIRLAQFGQIDEALARLEIAVELVPNSAELQARLGLVYLELDREAEAITALQTARELDPNNADILLTLGSAYLQQGSYFAAVEALERTLELQANTPEAADPTTHFQLGNAYLLRGDPDQARTQFEEAINLDTKFWPAINNIGLVDYEEGNIEAAMERWEAAIEVNDTVAEPKLALATALYIQGDTEAAEALGAEAIQLDPDYGRLETLRINLWGERLLRDVEVLLNTPTVRDALRQATAAQAIEEAQ